MEWKWVWKVNKNWEIIRRTIIIHSVGQLNLAARKNLSQDDIFSSFILA